MSGTMKSRWDAAWLLLLALKAFGLKEDQDASVGLQCLWILPNNVVNCSWSALDVNSTPVLFYQSHKYHPGQILQEQAQQEKNWLVTGKGQLMLGDLYSVWLETRGAAGMEASEKLNFSLDEIVKPPAPDLDPVAVSSSGVTVRWTNPHWSEHFAHQTLDCELRYKTSKDDVWTCLDAEDVSQEGHELEDLDPFTLYEVQARCFPGDGQGFWSEWSPPQPFRTPEAAPLGQLDVWQKVNLPENPEQKRHLLWKALDQDTARGNILNYAVDFLDNHKTIVASLVCVCCNVSVPASASYAQVSACNSAGKTPPAILSLEQTDLPGPWEVRVLPIRSLGLNVTWKFSPSAGAAQPEQYVVEWREEVSSELLNWTRRPVGCSTVLLRGDFRPKEPYLVSVYAVYAQGSNSSAPVRAYFQEGVPSAGPHAVQDRSISSTVSLISWEEIPLANRSGLLTHYTIYLKPPTSRSPKVYSPIGATERSYTLEGLEPGMPYQLWMTGSTSAGEGIASPVHHFRTHGAHWQIFVAVLLSVGFLLLLAVVVMLIMRTRVLSFCHKVLPLWCWERVPDPGHSLVLVKMGVQGAALAKEAPYQAPAKPPEETDVLEITEPAPPQMIQPAPVFSGYEKHFIPTREELQRLA
ncbi:interleukin-27 receptor subunit alpha isoform X2 [Eublepharis macularius]|uniref:Interleukin-27 receptor subunit alpha isoform X2 n=1 Tax=Eublepharis macularius TaxID=481883 RepID=A0AA97KNP1_EUBMA|nr:interleukin-27 receptor subunit alpha isoform X2 [Eublepharis macularius]